MPVQPNETDTATPGTARLLTQRNRRGAEPEAARPHSSRLAEKRLALQADSAEVRTTKLRIPAPPTRPAFDSVTTKGLALAEYAVHGWTIIFFNNTPTYKICTLYLPDSLPI